MDNESLQQRSMAPRSYARAIAILGLNQAQAARWLGVSERTSRRYVSGEATVPPAQVMLLRMAAELRIHPIVPMRRARHY